MDVIFANKVKQYMKKEGIGKNGKKVQQTFGNKAKRCFEKTKHAKIFQKNKSLLPPDTHQEVRNFYFLENFACFDFLKHPF